ncbi:Alpha-tectorin [Labeo rohita]|uniref:Alpha-tectorin n=1 Tax=Labeo rohita TaxID=84645 RepID=A0ABQ8M7C3_LABRO|nr:Alpha-tectorin [Labeo rohita]
MSVSNPQKVIRGIRSIIIHPDYNHSQLINDIALLRLSKPVNFTNYISPICLAGASGTLQEVKMKVVGNKECNCRLQDSPLWDKTITPNLICAGRETGEGTCFGDSGGPLQCKQGSVWILAGVTTFGSFCGTGIAPDSYARVSKLQNWILQNINGSEIGFVNFTSDGEDKDSSFLCNEDIELFYPFGNTDIKNPVQDDGSSPVILLKKPYVYFGHIYQQIYVNNNGHLTFDGPLSQPTPSYLHSQLNRDIIAPLWTNMDNTVNGTIFYRQVTSGRLLIAASNNITKYFPNLNFTASWLFIATWDRVPYYNNSQSSSSFQVVLASGGSLSFVMMNYGNISSANQQLQAGYGTVNSTNYFSIPVLDENKLFNSSNVNMPGHWIFRVDGGPEDEDLGSSPLIPLAQPFVYFGIIYDQLHVNNKGHLTFNEAFYQWYPYNFPAYSTRDIIAPLWTDLDISLKGTISYRQVTDSHLLNRATRDINQYYPNLNFSASWVFIATWDKMSTFQVVLVSGKNMSFILMHYDHIAPPPYDVESGYDTSDSIDFFSIPVSDTTYLPYTSNVNVMGRWAFRVDLELENNGLFYPAGYQDSQDLCQSDASSPALHLQYPFLYFGRKYHNIYVNNNGYLTFEPFYEGLPKAFPANSTRDIIAPLWAKFDCSVNASISYRIATQGRILDRAKNDVKQYFPQFGFPIHTVFIATWNRVPYVNSTTMAGYDTLNSTNYFSIPVPDENKLFNSSNVNVSGRWVFRVDGGPEEGIFYPYDDEDTKNPAEDLGSSPLIPLAQPFTYFGIIYNQLHVNNKGHLTFNNPFYRWYPYYFPARMSRDIIAPLWTDIDITHRGTISYRQVTDSRLLNRASKDINQYYPNLNFSASWVFIATWDKVPYYEHKGTESTFQVVLVSGKNMSFILMHYDHIAPPPYDVESGYDTSDSTDFFSIPVSDVTYLSYTSNVNVMGRWVFRVDKASENNGLFYPFRNGQKQNLQEYYGFSEHYLETPFSYFGFRCSSVYVHKNGFLFFNWLSFPLSPPTLPAKEDIVAPLWTDIDNSDLYFQEFKGVRVLQRVTNDIRQYFPHTNFTADSVFICTWDNVTYSNTSAQNSSFQVLLISGSGLSFIVFNYGGIPQTKEIALAGYDTDDSTSYYTIPVSNVASLTQSTNVNVTGRWAFHILPIKRGLFYPTGYQDSQHPCQSNASSPALHLEYPFLYFGRKYHNIYVNNNGLLTFEPFYEGLPKAFPANSARDIIAPLWAKFDCGVRGSISYRVVTRGRILDQATNDVNQYFPLYGFSVHTVFIATWNRVPYLNSPTTESSFQVVLIICRTLSFIIMNYGNISSTDQSFQAGYDTINSANYFSVPVPDENKLFNSSNVNVPGRWVFRVDGGPEEGIFYPYGDVEDEMSPQLDDGSSPLIPLLQPFVYFGHVNNNGDLTFDGPFYQWYPHYFPAYSSIDIIAPLWTDIDNTEKGTISYRQVTDAHLLNRASREINKYFPNSNFSASWVFVVTWDKVPYFGNKKSSGFDAINSTNSFSIPVSDIAHLSYTSNVNVMGRWVFRVDNSSESHGFCTKTNPQALGLTVPDLNFLVCTPEYHAIRNGSAPLCAAILQVLCSLPLLEPILTTVIAVQDFLLYHSHP